MDDLHPAAPGTFVFPNVVRLSVQAKGFSQAQPIWLACLLVGLGETGNRGMRANVSALRHQNPGLPPPSPAAVGSPQEAQGAAAQVARRPGRGPASPGVQLGDRPGSDETGLADPAPQPSTLLR